MPNQAYYDKIEALKKEIMEAAECLPTGVNVTFEGEDDDYGVHVEIDGFHFTLGSEECKQERTTLLGKQTRTYEGWNATVYDEEGYDIYLEEISEICGLGNIICECYLWTVRHTFNNKAGDLATYNAWKDEKCVQP